MRRIITTKATCTKRLGIGAVRINNEERIKNERSSDGGLSMWNWRGRSKGGLIQPYSSGLGRSPTVGL